MLKLRFQIFALSLLFWMAFGRIDQHVPLQDIVELLQLEEDFSTETRTNFWPENIFKNDSKV
jgi:hypothetical protein